MAVVADAEFDPGAKNMDIAVDAKGRVYVADTARLEICVFEPATGRRHERGVHPAGGPRPRRARRRPRGPRAASPGSSGRRRTRRTPGPSTRRAASTRGSAVGVQACELCTTECVVGLSAVRAVNDFSKCGRCYVCPAYFNITSAVDPKGLPSEKLCPRDAIERGPIGLVDPDDPANNFYEYMIDETKCDGCGNCVMECKEPAGLGSITLKVRHDRCVDCNRCAISRPVRRTPSSASRRPSPLAPLRMSASSPRRPAVAPARRASRRAGARPGPLRAPGRRARRREDHRRRLRDAAGAEAAAARRSGWKSPTSRCSPSRWPRPCGLSCGGAAGVLVALSAVCLAYFGFYREGCICPIGSIQNVAVALVDPRYAIPIVVIGDLLPAARGGALLRARVLRRRLPARRDPGTGARCEPIAVPRAARRALGVLKYVYLARRHLLRGAAGARTRLPDLPLRPVRRFLPPRRRRLMMVIGAGVPGRGHLRRPPVLPLALPVRRAALARLALAWRSVTITPDRGAGLRPVRGRLPLRRHRAEPGRPQGLPLLRPVLRSCPCARRVAGAAVWRAALGRHDA